MNFAILLILILIFFIVCGCKSNFPSIGHRIHHDNEYMKCVIGDDNCNSLYSQGATSIY